LRRAEASPEDVISGMPNPGTVPDVAARGSNGLVSCIAPRLPNLPYTLDGNVKVFRLNAEPVTNYFPDMSDFEGMGMGRRPIHMWGYNGSSPGPTLEVVEGDTVRIIVTNNLPEPTTVHWHGLEIPLDMDGVPDFSQKAIPSGGSFTYQFTINQPAGTTFYHSHCAQAKQIGLGLMGFFIIHPRKPEPWQIVDRDYAYILQTWMIPPGSPNPDTMEMSNFNYFTMNGTPGPDIVPMKARVGERVRIRVTNLSMLTHPVHLHGHNYRIVDLGGGFLPPHQHMRANTTGVSAAEVRVLDFVALQPGKWLFHCHFAHHTMNDMDRPPFPGTMQSPNMNMDMGGMHTWIEIT
jgi:FtsP/CotA-like multicopper oxidase with cupredoxin domain